MELNNWTPLDVAKQAFRLHDSVLSNLERDVKYRLEHRNGKWFTMSPDSAVREMQTGEYRGWTGPHDEAEVDRKLRISPPTPRIRTQDELMNQVKQVRKRHIRI